MSLADDGKGCGRTLGHGESCTAGWLCNSCGQKYRLMDKLESFAERCSMHGNSEYAEEIRTIMQEELG